MFGPLSKLLESAFKIHGRNKPIPTRTFLDLPKAFDPNSHDTTKKTRKIELRSKSLEHTPQLLDTEEKSPYKKLLPRYDRNQARSKSTTAKRYRTQMIR